MLLRIMQGLASDANFSGRLINSPLGGQSVTCQTATDGCPTHTHNFFSKIERELQCMQFNDEDWIEHISSRVDDGIGPLDDVPEEAVDACMEETTTPQHTLKVRPIQMREFLRTYVSKRLPALNVKGITKRMTAIRQLGVKTQWGGWKPSHFPSTGVR